MLQPPVSALMEREVWLKNDFGVSAARKYLSY